MSEAASSVSRKSADSKEELALRLNGISGALAFVAQGCRDAEGPSLWDALTYLSNELSDVALTSVRLTAEMVDGIEDWRRMQPKIPAKATALRELLRAGLDAYKGKLPKKVKPQ